MKFVIGIALFVFALLVFNLYNKQRRKRLYTKAFPIFKQLVSEGKFHRALDMLEQESVLRNRYKLEPNQRRQLVELRVQALEALNRGDEATVALAHHLSAVYQVGKWPSDLLSKWLSLYKSCEPIEVEKFYFCQVCGLHPETEALLRYAEEQGCTAPEGFPGKHGSAVVIHFGGKKEI